MGPKTEASLSHGRNSSMYNANVVLLDNAKHEAPIIVSDVPG